MGLKSQQPVLLSDEQMRQFIANGYLLLRPSVPDEVHRTIDEKFNFIVEHEFNPGNNIIPRIPELELILNSPQVQGALTSVLGENYFRHPHRYWHMRQPVEDALSGDEVAKSVSGGCHQDSYSPCSQPRSHRTRYARIMYYSQDTPIEMGPTHVLAGTQCHDRLTDEDRNRVLPVDGKAGLVFLSHFDIGHAAGVNMQDRSRHMIKFIFMRAQEPRQPSWDCEDTEWQQPEEITAPYDLEPAWRSMWYWHCGEKAVSLPPDISESSNVPALVETLNAELSVEEKLRALTELAAAGPEAVAAVPALSALLNTAHQALRTSAIYALASIGEPAIHPLCRLLEQSGERASRGEESPDFDSRWMTLHDAAYALGTIGAPALEPLIGLLGSAHEWTRMNAAFALGEMDSEAASAVPALETSLQDESHYVIRVAANSLGAIKKDAPVEALARLLRAQRPAWDEKKNWGWTVADAVHVTAAMALTRLGDGAAASEEALIDALQIPFGQVGFFAVQTLNRVGTESARQAVIDDLISRRWDATITAKRSY